MTRRTMKTSTRLPPTDVITRRGKALVKIVPIIEDDPTASVWGSVEESRGRFGPLTDDLKLPRRIISRIRPDPLD